MSGKKILLVQLFFFFSIILFGQDNLYKERFRPQFHFSPAKNWTNDPNGEVYFDGEYHLFYQYNPFGNRWGHMSWGHAVSKDLVHWKQLPLAIPEKDSVMIFSGSAVVDKNNTSGFAKERGQIPMVAIYTGHISYSSDRRKHMEEQHIAYSLNKGRTWTKYSGNPVLNMHQKNFRDPKVFWYEPEKKWVMVVSLPKEHRLQFYSSPDLKSWNHLSDFGPAGDTHGAWECPDLLQVPISDEPGKTKWVLLNSQQNKMQYFVGEFDGTSFKNENPSDKNFRPDYGPDYYAGTTYNNLPAGHTPVLIGWANNWEYANDIPTFPWKSAMALPRELKLKKQDGEWILTEQPLGALKKLRYGSFSEKNVSVNGKALLPVRSQQLEMEITFQPLPNSSAGIQLAAGKSHFFIVGYDNINHKLFIDRSRSSDTSFNKNFDSLSRYETPLMPQNGKIKLHVFFDNSIIEIFANDGSTVMTVQIFPAKNDDEIGLFSDGAETNFESVKVWKMKSTW